MEAISPGSWRETFIDFGSNNMDMDSTINDQTVLTIMSLLTLTIVIIIEYNFYKMYLCKANNRHYITNIFWKEENNGHFQ